MILCIIARYLQAGYRDNALHPDLNCYSTTSARLAEAYGIHFWQRDRLRAGDPPE